MSAPTMRRRRTDRQPGHYAPPTGDSPKACLARLRGCGVGAVEYANTQAQEYVRDVAAMILRHPQHTDWAMQFVRPLIEAAAAANADNDVTAASLAYGRVDASSDAAHLAWQAHPTPETEAALIREVEAETARATDFLGVLRQRRLRVMR